MIRWVLVALAGAVLCTICDHLHASHGVLWYPNVAYWEQAWWVPLLFAIASVGGVASAGWLRHALDGRALDAPNAVQLAGDAVGFVTAYVYTAFGHGQPNVVAGVLFGFWLARALNRTPLWLVAFSILVGIAGTLFEAGWSALGFFHYRAPDIFGVPRWLPGIYLHAAFLMASIERVTRRGRHP